MELDPRTLIVASLVSAALLSAADTALYAAKDGGRNRIVMAGTPGTA